VHRTTLLCPYRIIPFRLIRTDGVCYPAAEQVDSSVVVQYGPHSPPVTYITEDTENGVEVVPEYPMQRPINGQVPLPKTLRKRQSQQSAVPNGCTHESAYLHPLWKEVRVQERPRTPPHEDGQRPHKNSTDDLIHHEPDRVLHRFRIFAKCT